MNLSENFTKRIQELAGIDLITETDNRKVIVDKIGLPQVVADWAHGLSDKYAIWIANSFKNKVKQVILRKNPPAIAQEIIKQFKGNNTQSALKNQIERERQIVAGAYSHIIDWLTRRTQIAAETDVLNFKDLTFEQALERSNIWHDKLKTLEAGQIKDESGDVVITFPDGFYWIALNKSFCGEEAKAMNHCGNAAGQLYSLRKEKYPYLTADVERGDLLQLRGRGNSKPKQEYHKYIIEFLTNPKIGIKIISGKNTYRPLDNFSLSDLSEHDMELVMGKNASLANSLDIATEWPKEKIFDYLKKHEDAIDTFDVDSYITRFYEEPSSAIEILQKFPTLVLKIDFNDIINDLAKSVDDDPKHYSELIYVLVNNYPQILNENTKTLALTYAAFYSKNEQVKEKLREKLNKGIDKWMGDSIHLYFDEFKDLKVFFDDDGKRIVEWFFGEDNFGDYDSAQFDWKSYDYYINEKTTIKLINKIKERTGNDDVTVENMDEFIEDDQEIQDALERAEADGLESGQHSAYFKKIFSELEKIGFNEKYEWVKFKRRKKGGEPGDEEEYDKLMMTMSQSNFYNHIENALPHLRYEYGDDFDIQQIIVLGQREGKGLISLYLDNVHGDTDEEVFNERLSDLLTEI